ncbi:hypothetical protein ABZ876_37465, partial [Streptomyces sp. NPDC046931]|uniref:hypothetical protein n=1 Tax=Streptomyces sp. NPDC046931 TaxID=3154806 RepID=UPI00340B9C52
ALTAIGLSLPCSAGVRFLPGLKAGASSEVSGEALRQRGVLGALSFLMNIEHDAPPAPSKLVYRCCRYS